MEAIEPLSGTLAGACRSTGARLATCPVRLRCAPVCSPSGKPGTRTSARSAWTWRPPSSSRSLSRRNEDPMSSETIQNKSSGERVCSCCGLAACATSATDDEFTLRLEPLECCRRQTPRFEKCDLQGGCRLLRPRHLVCSPLPSKQGSLTCWVGQWVKTSNSGSREDSRAEDDWHAAGRFLRRSLCQLPTHHHRGSF